MHLMKATCLFYDKVAFPDGAVVEMVIWRVPELLSPSTHGLKFRLFYGFEGRRIVGYGNERGKGDHRHFRGRESAYRFVSAERLVADFLADVDKIRGGES